MALNARVSPKAASKPSAMPVGGQTQPVSDYEFENAGGSRAERHAKADLRRPQAHRGSQHAIEAHACQQRRDRRESPDEQQGKASRGLVPGISARPLALDRESS